MGDAGENAARQVWRFVCTVASEPGPLDTVRVVLETGREVTLLAHYVRIRDNGTLEVMRSLPADDKRFHDVQVQLVASYAAGRWVEVHHVDPA